MAKNGFEKLCDDIAALVSSGNVRDNDSRIRDLMEAYASIEDEWKKYATYEEGRYTRNLVRGGERDPFELILLCWYTGCKSPVHDHAESHCFMKIMQGTLRETRYKWPEQENASMEEKERTDYEQNQVGYIKSSGLHAIENPRSDVHAVSLHCYIPPITQCFKFKKETGEKESAKMKYDTRP